MLSPETSLAAVVISLAGTLVPALVAGWLAVHHLDVLLRLRNAARISRVDRPGSVVLSGRVVADEGDSEPVKVVIEQERVAAGASPIVLWREVARTPTLRPFSIALANGAHVRVEPDPDTRIANDLSLEVEADWGPLASGSRPEGYRRRRSASIRAGDEIQLVGALRASTKQGARSSAFRGAMSPRGADDTPPPRSLVVRRHPLEPLLLSKRKLSRERAPRALLHAFAFVIFAAGLFLHLALLAPYYRLALWGMPMSASVVAAVTPEGDVSLAPKAGDRLRLALELEHARVVATSEPVDAGLAAQTAEAQRDRRPLSVAVLVWNGHREKPSFVIGTRPRTDAAALPLAALAMLLSAGYSLAGRRARPWFERHRLNEREPHLEDPFLAKSR